MTWLGDEKAKVAGAAKDKLLADRAKLVREVEILSMKPLPNKSQAAALGRQEDLIALAKRIKVIDKKLGRDGQYA
jgi:hypothetical protein